MLDAHSPGLEAAIQPDIPTCRSDTEAVWPAMLDQRNELVLEHLPLVKSIAARCRVRLPSHVEFSDLVQAGILGLLDAAEKFKSDIEVSFSTYATHRITGAILDSLRKEDPAARKLRRRHRELESVRGELTQELQRCPTESEVSERSGIDLDTLRATAQDIHHVNQLCDQDSTSSAGFELSETRVPEPETIYQGEERSSLVKQLIGKLPESHKMVLTMHYMTNISLKEIGGSCGLPERKISRMHTQALQRIHAMLRTKGITTRSEL
jgi:RNA polymerase sigma factor for flagellar operon FliA